MRKYHDIGLKPGILDRKHVEAMGMAYWLYSWIILHQTKSTGLVHGGAVVTYKIIQEELNMPTRTLKRWMATLKEGGYIVVTNSAYMRMRIQVNKSKKFEHRQETIEFPENHGAKSGPEMGPKVAHNGAKSGPVNKSSKERYIEPLKKEAPPVPGIVPVQVWLEWVAHRKNIKKPLTPHAIDLQIRDLTEWKAEGLDLVEIIECSIKNGWTGLFKPKKENGNGTRKESATDLAIRNAKTLGLTH